MRPCRADGDRAIVSQRTKRIDEIPGFQRWATLVNTASSYARLARMRSVPAQAGLSRERLGIAVLVGALLAPAVAVGARAFGAPGWLALILAVLNICVVPPLARRLPRGLDGLSRSFPLLAFVWVVVATASRGPNRATGRIYGRAVAHGLLRAAVGCADRPAHHRKDLSRHSRNCPPRPPPVACGRVDGRHLGRHRRRRALDR